jgi:DNA-binding XRE family transcriptional regulator
MDVAQPGRNCDTDATALRLNETVFDRLTTNLGAMTDVARAELLGIDRSTIRRLRDGRLPSLETAFALATKLSSTVEQLFGPGAQSWSAVTAATHAEPTSPTGRGSRRRRNLESGQRTVA